jgi:integrase
MDAMNERQPRRGLGRYSETYPIEQQARRLAAWPALDRAAWERACRTADGFLDDPGAAASLRASTRRNRVAAWGAFLNFLERRGELDPTLPPETRPTPARVSAWVADLSTRQRATTVQRMLVELTLSAKALAPGHDWAWIKRHPDRPRREAIRAARKPVTPFDAGALLNAAWEELSRLEQGQRTYTAARDVRDLTLIVVGLYTALRASNLASIRVGQHLTPVDDRLRISFAADEMKTHEACTVFLSPLIRHLVEHYIATWRPLLLGDAEDDGHLWLASKGRFITAPRVYAIFRKWGERLIGRPINPHLTRHTVATGLMTANPTALPYAAAALGHRNNRSVNETYDRTGMEGAHLAWQRIRRKLRR